MRQDARARRRLAALGIDVWVRRAPRAEAPAGAGQADAAAGPASAPVPAAAGPAAPSAGVPPIRLAPGRGRWLLLLEGSDRADLSAFLDDLRGLLGADACRFGQWSDSSESGVAADEWPSRGIEWVLDFGGTGVPHPAVLTLPPVDELMASGRARKALWQTLRPLLEAA